MGCFKRSKKVFKKVQLPYQVYLQKYTRYGNIHLQKYLYGLQRLLFNRLPYTILSDFRYMPRHRPSYFSHD